MRRLTAFRLVPVLLAASVTIAGCADWGGKTESMEEQTKRQDYKFGSILGTEGGFNLFGKNKRGSGDQDSANGLGVNSFLWRASLDTLSFMPIASADPFGGVILTDWYTAPETPNERFKVNLYILDKQLRADGVRVSVFKQQRNGADWRDSNVGADTASTLEDAVLTRARQLRVAAQAAAR